MSIYYKNEDMSTPPQLNNGVPPGVIALWSGTIDTIPSGWALCDGNNGTPNLKARFVMGATTPSMIPSQNRFPPGTSGGKENVTLEERNVAPHSHSYFKLDIDFERKVAFQEGDDGYLVTGYNVVGQTSENSYTGNRSFSILPPYYALCYIMKLPV